MEREIALNEAKEALEKAFTPEIEKMLEENGSKMKVWEDG
jgi:N-acetyl-beta-hexosaminidase